MFAIFGIAAATAATYLNAENMTRNDEDLGGLALEHFAMKQPNPAFLQQRTHEDRRYHAPPLYDVMGPEQKSAEPFLNFDRNLRDGPLPQDVQAALENFQFDLINPDLPYTGWNNSTDNYHVRYTRSIPRGMTQGRSQVSRGSWSVMPELGDYPPVKSIMGTNQEPIFVNTMQGWSRTGPRLDDDGCPIFAAPPVLY